MRDLRVQEFLRELVVGVATSSDLAGSILMEILHIIEGGDVEQVCSNLEINLLCLRFLSLTWFYILHAIIVYIFYILDIPLCFTYMCVCMPWIFCSVFNQESHIDTSTFNLEES